MVTRFMCWPAIAARCLPTAVEPVKVTLRITGCGIRYSEISAGTPKTRLTTPFGRPASTKHRTSPAQLAGVSSGPFRMIEQPAATAPEILRTAWLLGKFKGVKIGGASGRERVCQAVEITGVA